MTEKLHPVGALKAVWSRMRLPTKLLLMLGVLAVLVGSLAWEEDTCGAGRVLVLVQLPLETFKKMSVADAEQREMVTVNMEGREATLPFGFTNERWEELKRRYEKGDCLFHYRTSPETWKALYGSEGYLLIRDGEVIYSIHTEIN